ncbi:MAG: DUF1801 domain-containing protein [Clostridiaceae bacterium]
MNEAVENCLAKYGEDVQALFSEIRALIMDCAPCGIEEKLWAKLPSYRAGESFVRLIPFKDHINVEAAAMLEHRPRLEQQYKLTPKGMLQIYLGQDIPQAALREVFAETLAR